MEVFNALLEQADLGGMLSPLPGNLVKFRASIFADDLVIFAGASGLLTNLDKCMISPIPCSNEDVEAIHEVFPCQLSPFPCKYLKAPLSTKALKRSDE
jgi:hypothetical protein